MDHVKIVERVISVCCVFYSNIKDIVWPHVL